MSFLTVSDEQLSEAIKRVSAIIPRLNLKELMKLEHSVNMIARHKTAERAFNITSLVLQWKVALRNAELKAKRGI